MKSHLFFACSTLSADILQCAYQDLVVSKSALAVRMHCMLTAEDCLRQQVCDEPYLPPCEPAPADSALMSDYTSDTRHWFVAQIRSSSR